MPLGSEGVVSRVRPQKWTDNQIPPPRLSAYREQYVQDLVPDFLALADEGSYWVTTNPTPGTAVNYAIQAAFSDTVAAITLMNKDAAGGLRCYLDYIRLIAGATVPASATAGHYAIKTDVGSRASAGTALTPNNSNMDATGVGSITDARWTPTVAAVSPQARLLSRGVLRSQIPVANDEWIFNFGSVEKAAASNLSSTLAQRMVIPCPPVVLGPGTGQTFLLHLWFPANAATAGQFEWEVAWYER